MSASWHAEIKITLVDAGKAQVIKGDLKSAVALLGLFDVFKPS